MLRSRLGVNVVVLVDHKDPLHRHCLPRTSAVALAHQIRFGPMEDIELVSFLFHHTSAVNQHRIVQRAKYKRPIWSVTRGRKLTQYGVELLPVTAIIQATSNDTLNPFNVIFNDHLFNMYNN